MINQTVLIISLILLLVKVARVYNTGSNKSYSLPGRPHLLALLPLALTIVMVSGSERYPLRGPPASPPSTVYFFIILNYHKIRLITVIIIFLIILLTA